MAAYAALVSLINILNRVQIPHPHHGFLKKIPTSTLFDQVSFLIDFVEVYSQKRSNEIKILESKIVDAAYATEDVIESYIESYIADRILAKSAGENYREYDTFCEDLQKAVQQMNLIQKEVMKIKLVDDDDKHFNEKNLHSRIEASGPSSIIKPPGGKKNSTMVGFEEDLEKLMELLSTYRSDRQIIPIVGMGGIGKTTLARNTYDHPFIINNFVIRAWVTISQEYSAREIILGILYDISIFLENQDSFKNRMSEKSDEQLGEQLHKSLFGRKYLIVLDDIWSSSAWDAINKFLPDNSNASRIMMTTRLSALALSLGSSLNRTYAMKFLDDDKSWNLLSKKVFSRQQVCPPELEKFGRIIAKNCKGLPLAIVVIGGLLKVSNKTEEYWANVAENVMSIVNTENDDNCLKILSLSYNELPVHLKPLFLYIATFPEDSEIRVSKLIKLWVSEGFLKPTVNDQTLEEVAVEYLKDLIDRNLIMVQKRGLTNNIKTCHIHDLLRDLCLREAQNERFLYRRHLYHELGDSILQCIKVRRRFHVLKGTSQDNYCSRKILLHGLQTMLNSPSLWDGKIHDYLHGDIQQVVNAKYIAYSISWGVQKRPFSSISQLWNLETLIVKPWYSGHKNHFLPSEIWEMPHLRHLRFGGTRTNLPDPPPVDGDDQIKYCVLNNLQTLLDIHNFRCSGNVFCRVPNLKKMKINYKDLESEEVTYCLNNLVHFHKLETLHCSFYSSSYRYSIRTLSFPPNLKKLVLLGCRIPWENMSIVGSLPNLEVLKIQNDAFVGPVWNSVEGEFQHLKILSIYKNVDLKIWRAESSNFPTLEHLVIESCNLEEIPWGIGEIPSLQSIELRYCYHCVVLQAKDMLDEQQMQGNDDLHIHVHTRYPELQSLASDNFYVHYKPYSWR